MTWMMGRRDTPLDPDRDEEGEDVDQLDIGPYSEGLYRFVRQCDTPMTVGLQGEWGSGKTSLMKLVKSKLKGADHDSVITFWFETWQYGAMGGSDTLGILLLRDLTENLMTDLKDDPSIYMFREQMGKALRSALPTAIGLATSIATRSDRAGDAVQVATGSLMGGESSDMRRCFRDLVSKALAQKKGADRRLVVFIDDLDRVQPKLAVRLLEVLKNFMDVEDCVFVVACDYEVVREGVHDLMNIAEEQRDAKKDKVDAFFHKLFQVQFLMPVNAYKIDKLLRTYIVDRLIRHNSGPDLAFAGLDKTTKTQNRRTAMLNAFLETGSTEGAGATLAADKWFAQLVGVVESAVGTNPRAFKRFLNLVDLTCSVDEAFTCAGDSAESVGDTVDQALRWWWLSHPEGDAKTLRWCTALFPIVALQQRWPDVANYLLTEAMHKSRLHSELGDSEFTDFERRLRTILNDWPATQEGGDEGDVVESEFEDETFRQQLRESFNADVHCDDAPPSATDLITFARRWFRLLNNNRSKDNYLDENELFVISGWSTRLGNMGATRVRLGGIAKLRQECMTVDERAGDGFVALISHLLGISGGESIDFLYGRASSTGATWWVMDPHGSWKTLLVFKPKGSMLEIKVNATPDAAAKMDIPGLADAGRELFEGLQEEPVSGKVRRMPSAYLFDFGDGHRARRNELLRPLFGDFIDRIDSLARVARQPASSVVDGSASGISEPNTAETAASSPECVQRGLP